MSGVDLLIQRMSDHDFSAIAQGSSENLVVLLKELDVSPYREGTLEVLMKAVTLPTGATLVIQAVAMARSDDDSGKLYALTTSPVATVTVSSSKSDIELFTGAFSVNFGPFVAIRISANNATGSGTFTATFETRVSLKN